jgi:hypothetical protein
MSKDLALRHRRAEELRDNYKPKWGKGLRTDKAKLSEILHEYDHTSKHLREVSNPKTYNNTVIPGLINRLGYLDCRLLLFDDLPENQDPKEFSVSTNCKEEEKE